MQVEQSVDLPAHEQTQFCPASSLTMQRTLSQLNQSLEAFS
jgi:hypothetical protein